MRISGLMSGSLDISSLFHWTDSEITLGSLGQVEFLPINRAVITHLYSW